MTKKITTMFDLKRKNSIWYDGTVCIMEHNGVEMHIVAVGAVFAYYNNEAICVADMLALGFTDSNIGKEIELRKTNSFRILNDSGAMSTVYFHNLDDAMDYVEEDLNHSTVKEFLIPITWKTVGMLRIKARNMDEAIEIAKKADTGDAYHVEEMEDTLEVERADVEFHNDEDGVHDNSRVEYCNFRVYNPKYPQ